MQKKGAKSIAFRQLNGSEKRRLAGENASDEGLSLEDEFRRVATNVLDTLCMEMGERFKRLREHVGRFGFLLQTDLLFKSMDEDTLKKHCTDFASFYDEVQPASLFTDVLDARVLFLNKEVPKAPQEILKKLASYGNDVCPNLAAAIQILITLATSIASCERSFSKLKLIKSYLRSTMGQERLSNLVLMSVESSFLDKIELDDIINDFAAKKARRGVL